MKIYTFGEKDKPSIMLLPGTCCHWKKNFGQVIPLLEKDFYVLCVSYDGFDETEKSLFIDMIDETQKIEKYILENMNGQVDIVYGCSLGGSFVGLLMQRQIIHMNHGILGSSDLDQERPFLAKLKSKIAIPIVYKMLQTGKLPSFMEKKIKDNQSEYIDKMLEMFGIGSHDMSFVDKKSVYNQFYSDLITPLDKNIFVKDTSVHVFYAKKMGNKYLQRYQEHFYHVDIIPFDMQHEELLTCYPIQWVEEIKKIVNKCQNHYDK